jgi:hypothetical protein
MDDLHRSQQLQTMDDDKAFTSLENKSSRAGAQSAEGGVHPNLPQSGSASTAPYVEDPPAFAKNTFNPY